MTGRPSRPATTMFFVVFGAFTVGLLVWLAAGFAPAIVRAVPGVHRALHAWGGNDAPSVIRARDLTFEPAVVRLPSVGTVSIRFVNADDGVRHNVSIYDGSQRIFLGKIVPGGTVREYSFPAPPEGSYAFRCDVHPVMEGVVEATGASPARRGWAGGLARNVADTSHASEPIGQAALDYAFSLLNLGLGLFLVRRRPHDATARFFGTAMLGTAAAYNLQSHAALTVIPRAGDLLHQLWHPFAGIAYVYALLLFPDGRLVPRWSRRPVRVAYALATLVVVVNLMGAAGLIYPEPGAGHAVAFVQFFGLLVPAVGIASQLYRLRRVDPVQRQQSRVLLWALAPALALGLFVVGAFGVQGQATGSPVPAELPRLAFRVFQPVFALIPIALVVGILRYRLWDIAVVVRRTVVFGALAAFITAVYAGVVVGVGSALGRPDNVLLSIAATTFVAVAFEPVRERVQRVANRLVYGERASPYEVLAGLSRGMAGALSIGEVLPQMAEAAASGLAATRGRVRVFLAEGRERSVSWPDEAASIDVAVPVVQNGEPIGEIAIGKRAGDQVTPADRRLLEGLAAQAGPAMHNVRLTEELRERFDEISWHARELAASRQRLISAEDAERRRLEREITAGVGRHLARTGASLELAERTIVSDPGAACAMLDDAVATADEAQDALRDLTRGFWFPLLADSGVVTALEAQVRKGGYPVSFRTSAMPVARFDGHTEAAVYFCCLEALRDAYRRAPDRPIVVTIGASNGWLAFSVEDAAQRPDPDAAHVGLLRDRVEALGGSLEVRTYADGRTEVSGRVPVQPPT